VKAFFSEEKKQKNFATGLAHATAHRRNPFKEIVFCFFFSKKKRFLASLVS
jgi:hypothetical protein